MAEHRILAPFVRYYEGGFVNDPDDPGGATNKGVTLATFRSVYGKDKTASDLRKITDVQWDAIFKKCYWDKCKGDLVKDQSVANMLVDFAWHSGLGNAVPRIQRIVGVKADGIIGNATINAINGHSDQRALFDELKRQRTSFLTGRRTWWKYGRGWLRRVDAMCYGSLSYGGRTYKF